MGFSNQGFLQSGVLTVRGSYKQGFLQSGVYISVSYMTGLCLDIDIDRCSSGRCPDVDLDRCSLHIFYFNRSYTKCSLAYYIAFTYIILQHLQQIYSQASN